MKKEMFPNNLYPFVAIAFAKNPKVHSLIDELYNAGKEKYSTLAKKDFRYDSPLVSRYDLITENYAKKMLGLLQHMADEDIKALINKGWPELYSWATSVESLQIEECLERFFYEEQENAENIVIAIAVLYTTGQVLKKSVFAAKENMQVFNEAINLSADCISTNLYCHHDKMSKIQSNMASKIYQDICKQKKINYDFKNIWLSNDINAQTISMVYKCLFQLEDLSIDIVESTILNEYEFAEMVTAYLNSTLFEESSLGQKIKAIFSTEGDSFDSVCSSLGKSKELIFTSIAYMVYLRKTLKAYKEAKEFYNKKASESNKLVDSLNRKIAELETENCRLRGQVVKLEADSKQIEGKLNSGFNKTLYQYKAENKKLEDTVNGLSSKIDSYKKEIQLLLSLNTAMAGELQNDAEEIDYDFVNELNLKGLRGVIVGGHPKWQNIMKGYLPNFKFISATEINFDTALLENADAIFFNTRYASHSLLYKVISTVKNKNIDIHYINCNNKNYVLNRISDIAC